MKLQQSCMTMFLRFFFIGLLAVTLVACGPNQTEQDLAEQNASLEDRVADVRAELALAQGDLTDAREALEAMTLERDDAVERVASLEREVEALTLERDEALASLATLEDAMAEENASQGEEPEPANGVDDAEEVATQLAVTEVELSSARANLAMLQEELAGVEQERVALVASLESASVERDALQAQLDAERDAAAQALEEARSQASGLTRELAAAIEAQRGLEEISEAQREELARIRRQLEATQNQVANLSGARGIYTVQGADSLSSIAVFFYRQGSRWPDILAANDNLIGDADLIFPGMVLIIPE